MGDELLSRVSTYVQRHDLIRNGDRVLAAVSGGADSVCLLYVLQELQQTLEFELRVVHVHHGIRENAEKDLLFVENLCSKMRLPCITFREHVPEALKDSGMSLEEMARKIRYEDFRKALKEWKDEEGIQEASGEGGQSQLSALGSMISKKRPDFDSRNYGYSQLSKMLRSIPRFEVGGTGGHVWVKDKEAK